MYNVLSIWSMNIFVTSFSIFEIKHKQLHIKTVLEMTFTTKIYTLILKIFWKVNAHFVAYFLLQFRCKKSHKATKDFYFKLWNALKFFFFSFGIFIWNVEKLKKKLFLTKSVLWNLNSCIKKAFTKPNTEESWRIIQ